MWDDRSVNKLKYSVVYAIDRGDLGDTEKMHRKSRKSDILIWGRLVMSNIWYAQELQRVPCGLFQSGNIARRRVMTPERGDTGQPVLNLRHY